MKDTRISERGVYYDLSISPYVYRSPYGDIFKFSSRKKLEVYTRKIEEEKERLESLLFKFKDLNDSWKTGTRDLYHKNMYERIYNKVEVLKPWQTN